MRSSFPFDSMLEQLFTQRGYDRRRRLEQVFERWDEVIGEPACRWARPLSIENGVLTVVVRNSTLASEVLFSRELYLRRVNDHFQVPVVTELKARVQDRNRRPDALPGAASSQRAGEDTSKRPFRPEAISLGQEELDWVETTVSRLTTLSAQETLRRTLILHLKRRKWEEERDNPPRKE